ASSRAQLLPVRIEEGPEAHSCPFEPPVDLDLEGAALFPQGSRHPGHADGAADLLAPARARHAPGGAAVEHDLAAFGGNDAVLHLEADEEVAERALAHVPERAPADEVVRL